MRRVKLLACGLVVASAGSIAAFSQARNPPRPVLYEGARLIIGDGSAPIEGGAFLVLDGHIRALGRKGAVAAPDAAARVDLTGKTVMPAMINAHVHIGYEGYTSWSTRMPSRWRIRRRSFEPAPTSSCTPWGTSRSTMSISRSWGRRSRTGPP